MILENDTEAMLVARTGRFARRAGRRPRILLAAIRQGVSVPEIKAMASRLADFGFDVDINPKANIPEAMAVSAVENDAHVVGLLGLPAKNKTWLERFLNALATEGEHKTLTVVWTTVTTPHHAQFKGAFGSNFLVFGPETDTTTCADMILSVLSKSRAEA